MNTLFQPKNRNVQTNINFARKTSDVLPLFQALLSLYKHIRSYSGCNLAKVNIYNTSYCILFLSTPQHIVVNHYNYVSELNSTLRNKKITIWLAS